MRTIRAALSYPKYRLFAGGMFASMIGTWMQSVAQAWHVLRITGNGVGNNPPGADDIRLSPDASRAFISIQGKHYVVTTPRAGRETQGAQPEPAQAAGHGRG